MAAETEAMTLDPATVAVGVERVFAEPAIGHYMVALATSSKDSRALGCALVLEEWSEWRATKVWWIHSVFVEPESRGAGVFRAIFEAIEQQARAEGAGGVRLYVDHTNEAAQAVYRRLGMRSDHYVMFEKMFG